MKSRELNNSNTCIAVSLIAAAGLFFTFCSSAHAQGALEKVIYSFTVNPDGKLPASGLIADAAGNLYGTAQYGGDKETCPPLQFFDPQGCGTIFQLSPPTTPGGPWTETVLHSFRGGREDGAYPSGTLVFDRNGNLYGTTQGKGLNDSGTIFKLSPTVTAGGAWTESTLYSFPVSSLHESSAGSLVLDSDGNLYGATHLWGSGDCGYGCGTIFELSPPTTVGGAWTEKLIYDFQGPFREGSLPNPSLIFDRSGALYGTTTGTQGGPYPCGTVFKMKRQNGVWSMKTIYDFQAGSDANCDPAGGVTIDKFGNLYGTLRDVANGDGGGVYKLQPPPGGHGPWTEETVYAPSTDYTSKDGYWPAGNLLIDKAGNLYGANTWGGIRTKHTYLGNGTIFELSPPPSGQDAWTINILHRFAPEGEGDGSISPAGLIEVHSKLYGTTTYGGLQDCSNGCGTVFSLTVIP